MPETATTLVHKGAMEIAVHAIRTFSYHYSQTHNLQIHTDGSTDETDHNLLLSAAGDMDAIIVTSSDRQEQVDAALSNYPESLALIRRGGYFCKLELPIFVKKPFFYFDSDIVWLRKTDSFEPPARPNAFSTESWSWYFGVAKDKQWIREKIPRRVNSGFYYLSVMFPFARLERLVSEGLFDPSKPHNTDQEMMAFLYPDMEHYHPEDLKRSRVRAQYDLASETCIALHFPGKMWKDHLDQILKLPSPEDRDAASLRFTPTVPITSKELIKMRLMLIIAESRVLRQPVNAYRALRKALNRRPS